MSHNLMTWKPVHVHPGKVYRKMGVLFLLPVRLLPTLILYAMRCSTHRKAVADFFHSIMSDAC